VASLEFGKARKSRLLQRAQMNKSGIEDASGAVAPQFQQNDRGWPSIATATLFSEAMTMSRALAATRRAKRALDIVIAS
jgi:hypothetical protein